MKQRVKLPCIPTMVTLFLEEKKSHFEKTKLAKEPKKQVTGKEEKNSNQVYEEEEE